MFVCLCVCACFFFFLCVCVCVCVWVCVDMLVFVCGLAIMLVALKQTDWCVVKIKTY